MTEAPWYVSSLVVRRFMEISDEALSFIDATQRLSALCLEVWQRYQEPGRKPTLDESGHQVYRGPSPERLRLVVADRSEERRPHLLDVRRGHSGFRQEETAPDSV